MIEPYSKIGFCLCTLHLLIEAHHLDTFVDLLYTCENKIHVIFTFLAILELLQEQILTATLGMGFNNFWLSENKEPISLPESSN